MLIAITKFPNEWRKLKYFIQWLLMSKTATDVSRMNYMKSYFVEDNKLKNKEEKMLIIKFPIKNKEKLIAYFKKNHPDEKNEIIFVTPDVVWI